MADERKRPSCSIVPAPVRPERSAAEVLEELRPPAKRPYSTPKIREIARRVSGPVDGCVCPGCQNGRAQLENGSPAGGWCLCGRHREENNAHTENTGIMVELPDGTHSNGWCLEALIEYGALPRPGAP